MKKIGNWLVGALLFAFLVGLNIRFVVVNHYYPPHGNFSEWLNLLP